VLDFYCPEADVGLEADGDSHFQPHPATQERERKRHEFLERSGVTLLRFTNTDIYENLRGVLQRIYETLQRVSTRRSATRTR
jgi:very-short-patch-repair endonuclease